MPHTFFPRIKRSFGHFTFAWTPVRAKTASPTATAAQAVSTDGRRNSAGGNSTTDSNSELPGRLCHTRP